MTDTFSVSTPNCQFCGAEMKKVWEGLTPENNVFIAWICPECFSTYKSGIPTDSYYQFQSKIDTAFLAYYNLNKPKEIQK